MKYNTKLTFKIYWQHIRKYKFAAVFTVVTVMLGTTSELVAPIFYKQFFNIIVSSGVTAEATAQLTKILFFVIGTYLVSLLFHRASGLAANAWVSKVMRDLALTCFDYLHRHSFSFFNNNFVGSLVKRVNHFYHSFGVLHSVIMWEMVPLATNVIVITIVLFFQSALFGWVLVVWIALFVAVSYWISQLLLKYYVIRSEIDSEATGYLADTITNQSNVKLFTGLGREYTGFGEVTKRQRDARKKTWDLSNFSEALQAFMMICLEFVVLYVAIHLWTKGILGVGDFVLIQAYLLTIFHRFWNLGRHIREIYEQLAEAEEMTEIFQTPHEIADKKNARTLAVQEGNIEFQRVTFFYYQTRQVIKRMSISVQAHEKLALVGPSGAGKSTIVKLLLRQHEVSSGKILIDGQNIADVTLVSLWQNISWVPQDPILFHRSLLENIRYGKPDATEEEVFAAAKAAHCHEFISEFPEGYNTYVGERGVKLSGGERQRVAIARAILRNAPILVLDEATSSLDSESEQLIQAALDTLMKGRTVIVIAHRLSTIMKMDRILVVDQGAVIEEGTHVELLKKKDGLYKKLWHIQAGKFV